MSVAASAVPSTKAGMIIVSIDRHEVTVTGFANHAGTTPMADRQDALLAASHLTIAVREKIVSNASGGSDISYTGEPSVVTVNTSGGSDVRHR